MTPDFLYTPIHRQAGPDMVIPLTSTQTPSNEVDGFLVLQVKSGAASAADALCTVTPGCMYLPGSTTVLAVLRAPDEKVLGEKVWGRDFFNSFQGTQQVRDNFERHLPANKPILRGIFAYGGFDLKTTELVNAYNQTTRHPVLLLAPDFSNSYWKEVRSRLQIPLKQGTLDKSSKWALQMWTCQERQNAIERQLRIQREKEGEELLEQIHDAEEKLRGLLAQQKAMKK